VCRVAAAAAVAREAGAAVLLDALHIQRGGSTLDDVRALEPALVPVVQICDGPLTTPKELELPAALPLGMTADGSVLQVEARALRKVPGEGEFPLAELLAAVPASTPLSVEVPNATLQARMSPVEFAARNLRGARRLEVSRVA
jgi:sugar phosphate isomerase/epimerase